MNNNSTVSEIMLGILYAAPTLFQILVIFGGALFAITRIRRFPRPASWLAAGLAVILIGRIFGWLGTVYLARTTMPEDFVFYNSILSMLLSLISTAGLVLMMYAVFVSRSDRVSSEFLWNDGISRENFDSPKEDSNPYSTPTAG